MHNYYITMKLCNSWSIKYLKNCYAINYYPWLRFWEFSQTIFGICNGTLLGPTREGNSSERMYVHTFWKRPQERKRKRGREGDAKRGRVVQTGKQTQPARVRYSLFQSHRPIVRWWIILVDALDLQIVLVRNVLNVLTTKRCLLCDRQMVSKNHERRVRFFIERGTRKKSGNA